MSFRDILKTQRSIKEPGSVWLSNRHAIIVIILPSIGWEKLHDELRSCLISFWDFPAQFFLYLGQPSPIFEYKDSECLLGAFVSANWNFFTLASEGYIFLLLSYCQSTEIYIAMSQWQRLASGFPLKIWQHNFLTSTLLFRDVLLSGLGCLRLLKVGISFLPSMAVTKHTQCLTHTAKLCGCSSHCSCVLALHWCDYFQESVKSKIV